MSATNKKQKNPAIAKPSDLVVSGAGGRDLSDLSPTDALVLNAQLANGRTRQGLSSPMHMRLHGGETVELLESQVFSDKVVAREGELGVTLFPSSQAAAWVVRFPRVSAKPRVIPEPLLRVVDGDLPRS